MTRPNGPGVGVTPDYVKVACALERPSSFFSCLDGKRHGSEASQSALGGWACQCDAADST